VAQFNRPNGVAVDAAGNIYVADTGNSRIRKITPDGMVTTLAGSSSGYFEGTGTVAQFATPSSVAVDGAGNIYVADTSNYRIRRITPGGAVTTLAGSTSGYKDDTGAAARFWFPQGVAADGASTVYVADTYNHRIRVITPDGEVTTLAGSGGRGMSSGGYQDGPGGLAQFTLPSDVAVDGAGNVYVADFNNHRIRRITPGGAVTTLAGSGLTGYDNGGYKDGPGGSAQFNGPLGVAVDTAGNVYVADTANHRIRKITWQEE
jgi:sugar lactone lactonase YvrE